MLALETRVVALDASLRAVEEKLAAAASAPAASSAGRAELQAVAEDMRALRDAFAAELKKVDARLFELRRRIDEQNAPRAPREGPLSEEEENRWAVAARDPDPGMRFSALTMLGRGRTERSVNLSIDRLSDEDPEVVWVALLNLGRFKERAAAALVAPLLDHAAREVRAAAYDALLAMGAPRDTGYNPVEKPEKRKAAEDALKKWAETP